MDKKFEEDYSHFINDYTKEELAHMLSVQKQINDAVNKKLDEPYVPCNCKSWVDCTNPHYDCINCPLRYPYGNGVTAVSITTTLDDNVRNKA